MRNLRIERPSRKTDILTWVRTNRGLTFFLALIFLFFLVNFLIVLSGRNRGYAPTGKYSVIITPGMTTKEISEILYDRKLIRHPGAFRFEARIRGLAGKLQAGLYSIDGGMNNTDIVRTLSKGRVHMCKLTVPEGFSVTEVANALQSAGLGSAAKFCQLAKNYAPYDYMKTGNKQVIYAAEGFLYPAVYDFPASYSEQDLLELMVRTFHEELCREGVLQEAKKGQLNLREVITMASLVEKEAVFEEEQPLIAGIFLKRLKIGMPLQSDTTVQYILGGKQREIIYYKDTEISHPYNTYQNYGLPPGPIASPGMSAIMAVLHPKKSDYLYFVAEKDGHHRFTANYDDHLRAISDIENGR